MNIELRLDYEENGQIRTLATALELSGDKEASYSLQIAVGEVLLSFRPKASESTITAQVEPKMIEIGTGGFNEELRRKMEERNIFAPKHKSR